MEVKRYNVIYADPPWSYNDKMKMKGGHGLIRGAESFYNTMSTEDIMNMPIDKISESNSILFLWATIPLMEEGMQVLKSWGFRYKTSIIWEKTKTLGMGHWLRVQTEVLLIGTKGRVKPFKHQGKNIYQHPVCKHSAKPHFFRELVMNLANKSFNECIRLELFARSREGFFPDYEYDGWDVYGNEVNNSISLII